MGGVKNLLKFYPLTSTNVGTSPQNFVTFNFNPLATLMLNFKAVPNASTKLLNLNQEHPSKNWFFWSNPCKIKVIITSLIAMLGL